MKKTLAFILSALLLVSVTGIFASALTGATFDSAYGFPVIGDTSDAVWESVTNVATVNKKAGWSWNGDTSAISVDVKIMNDAEYLYLRMVPTAAVDTVQLMFSVVETDMPLEGNFPAEYEHFDVLPGGNFRFKMADGTVTCGRGDQNPADIVTKKLADGAVEAKIPLSMIDPNNLSENNMETVHFELLAWDALYSYVGWGGTYTDACEHSSSTGQFSTLNLAKAPATDDGNDGEDEENGDGEENGEGEGENTVSPDTADSIGFAVSLLILAGASVALVSKKHKK